MTLSRTVNDTGTVASETNGRGFTTSFDYDALNRLTSIDFPIKSRCLHQLCFGLRRLSAHADAP